ncbi:MAG: lipoyl(octanoyl) transferase [Chloroflexi bacterium RBG_16_57_8]|nr:MAG: lipoyl(octanoyl) transferase [Chloroflexi bacterium RBG_16_57_8]
MLCHVHRLGVTPYDEAFRLQRELCLKRLNGETPDALLLVEHPPTITIGKSGKLENILASREKLDRLGVSLFFTDRGGDVTYHGPGQLVVYPIVDLRQRGRDIHAFVHDLEEAIIRTLSGFSIPGSRNTHAGVWVDNRQIAAIGIAVKKWITMHGIALNVSPDPAHFKLINPCGMAGVPVTSICELTGRDVSLDSVMRKVITEFAAVFGAAMQEAAPGENRR